MGSVKTEAKKRVKSGRMAIEWLLLHGKKKWKTYELQTAAADRFAFFMSESTVSRYCRDFCAPAIAPVSKTGVRSYTYIHKARV